MVDDEPLAGWRRGSHYYRPFDQMFGDDGVETSTLWNYKIVGRYVMPWDIGFSGSWKVQSGFNFARTISVTMPVEGAQQSASSRSTRTATRRSASSTCGSTRRSTRQVRPVLPMLDVFNMMNSGVPTTVRTTNTATAPFRK